MLASEVLTRAVVLGTVARPFPDMATSPNRSVLLGRQTTGCKTGEKLCVNSCIPGTEVCCG